VSLDNTVSVFVHAILNSVDKTVASTTAWSYGPKYS